MTKPEVWARPFFYTTQYGGIEWPDLPFAVVCEKCKAPVEIEAWECDQCGEPFHWVGSASKRNRQCVGQKSRAVKTLERTPSLRSSIRASIESEQTA